MGTNTLTTGVIAAFAAGKHLRRKDAGDPLEVLADKFADFSDAAMKRLEQTTTSINGVKLHVHELEQKLARDGSAEGFTAAETWGTQFVRQQAEDVKSLAQVNKGAVSLTVKGVTTAATSGGAMEIRTRDAPALMPRRRLTIRNLLPVVSISSGTVEYVQQDTRPTGAATVAEGAAESDIALSLETTTAKVIAHWMKASRQVLEDLPQLRDLIDNEMRYGLALAEETQILNGDGAGSNLSGLIPNATAFADPLTLDDPTLIDIIGAAVLQSALADFPADGIVMHPSDWMRIRLLKDTAGWYLVSDPTGVDVPRLFGLPVVATKAMTAGHFLVGSFAEAATLYDRWVPRVEVGYVDDDFTRNLVTILAEERLAMAVKQPLALTYGAFGAFPS